MSLSASGIAASLISVQTEAARQSFATAMAKQQAEAEASVVGLVEQALEAAKASAPPPPPGQGVAVDLTV